MFKENHKTGHIELNRNNIYINVDYNKFTGSGVSECGKQIHKFSNFDMIIFWKLIGLKNMVEQKQNAISG